MSYITLSSEQITSKQGELSIDIFNCLNSPDDSKFAINCNSYKNDGVLLNCPHGGIQLSSRDIGITCKDNYIKSRNFKLETVNELVLESLNSIKLTSINNISLCNDKDGFFYDIENSEIKILNHESLGKIILSSNDILIGNSEANVNIKQDKLNFYFNKELEISSNDYKAIIINNETKSLEINGDVFITGKLKFNKLETSKIHKIKLENIHNQLSFGSNGNQISDWELIGYHPNSESKIKFNYNSNMFEFKYNQNYANLKIGNLSIVNNDNNILETSESKVLIQNLKTNTADVDNLIVNNKITCKELIVNDRNILQNEIHLYLNNHNLEYETKDKEYLLFDNELNTDLIIDTDVFNYVGLYRNIIWKDSKISIRNTHLTSKFENFIFNNTDIYLINNSDIKFVNCSFNNCNINFENSKIIFTGVNTDASSLIKCDYLTCFYCKLRCSIESNDYLKIVHSDIYLSDNNKLTLKEQVIYHLTNNNFFIPGNIRSYILSNKDIILIDSWIINNYEKSSIFERNYIIKKQISYK